MTLALLSFLLLPRAGASSACEAALALAEAKMLTANRDLGILMDVREQLVAEETQLVAEPELKPMEKAEEVQFLLNLVMPKALVENQMSFEEARKWAESVLPLLEEIRKRLRSLDSDINFPHWLARMAQAYDEAISLNEQIAILAELRAKFAIRNENDYMHLLAYGRGSKKFKRALHKVLAQIFQSDPSWIPFLMKARFTGGY